jgi:hypothetical protein
VAPSRNLPVALDERSDFAVAKSAELADSWPVRAVVGVRVSGNMSGDVASKPGFESRRSRLVVHAANRRAAHPSAASFSAVSSSSDVAPRSFTAKSAGCQDGCPGGERDIGQPSRVFARACPSLGFGEQSLPRGVQKQGPRCESGHQFGTHFD